MRMPSWRVRARSSSATFCGKRLSSSALKPHAPGCSMRIQRRTKDAVPKIGSSRSRDASAQRKVSALNYLEQPFSNETSDEHQRAVGNKDVVQIARCELVTRGDELHRRAH